jgi:hypothetical protein
MIKVFRTFITTLIKPSTGAKYLKSQHSSICYSIWEILLTHLLKIPLMVYRGISSENLTYIFQHLALNSGAHV